MDGFLLLNWTSTVVLSLLLMLYVAYWSWKRRLEGRRMLPPGSLGLPFIGETIQFVSSAYSSKPERFMDKRRQMYGKVFKSHLFGTPAIVSIDAEVSRVVLQGDSSSFVPSYPKSLTELMGESSILLLSGNLQKKIHGLIGSFFKSSHLKTQFTDEVERYVHSMTERWEEGQLVLIQNEAKQIAFQVLVRGLIGLEPGEEMLALKQNFQEFIAGLMSLPVKIPGSRLYRSLQAKKRMVKFIKDIIKERRERNEEIPTGPRDVLDVLINDGSDQLTDDLVSDNMIDLMIPGEDSVPILMTLAVKYLSECPLALKQIEEENIQLKQRKAEAGEALNWSDYLALPFTQNNNKDMGTCNFTPFGGGQRLCPGLDLARLEASIFLHHLVTNFRWVAEKDTVVNFPTVRMKGKMPIRVYKKRGDNDFIKL